MRTLVTPLVAAALVLAACSADPLATEPDTSALASAGSMSAARVATPLRGRCELTVTPLPSTPPIIRQTDAGPCRLSQLGRAVLEGVLEINLTTGTQTGERTLTAANGDELYLSVVGTSAPAGPGLVSFVGNFTIEGGTGRFANATGTATGEGIANLVTRQTSVRIEGEILR
jgi:hypothetical protein